MRNGWTLWHLVGVAGMLCIGAYATAQVWRDIIRTAFGHGEVAPYVLVPMVAAILVWVRRERVRFCQPTAMWLGPLLVGVSWLTGWVGEQQDVLVLEHAAALGIVSGCVLAVMGPDAVRQFLPAWGVLLLLIPLPWTVFEHLILPLCQVVADFSSVLYGPLGVSIAHRGEWVFIGAREVPLLAACATPSFKAGFLVGYGLAFGQPLRLWVRLLILLVTPLVTLVVQVLAVPLVGLLAGLDELQGAWLGVLTGWTALPVVFVVLGGLIHLLYWAAVPVRPYALARDS